MLGNDKVGRLIITIDYTGGSPLDLKIQNVDPLLALGVLTLVYERMKRDLVVQSISPVLVPRMGGIPKA